MDSTGIDLGGWLRYSDEPFTLSSGLKSHYFIDGRKIFAIPILRELVIQVWVDAILRGGFETSWQFIGVPEGGTKWAQAIGEKLNSPWKSVRPEELDYKGHGTTFLVDDVVTTGLQMQAYEQHIERGMTLPKLVVVRRGPVSVTAAWISITLPTNRSGL